jgi:methyl-accepting chemotaxis protein
LSPESIFFKALTDYGLIGGVCAILCVVIVWQTKQITELNQSVKELVKEYATIATEVASSMNRSADVMEERNRVTDRLAESINRSAEATIAHSKLTEAQTSRVMDRFLLTDKVIESIAQGLRDVSGLIGRGNNGGRRSGHNSD